MGSTRRKQSSKGTVFVSLSFLNVSIVPRQTWNHRCRRPSVTERRERRRTSCVLTLLYMFTDIQVISSHSDILTLLNKSCSTFYAWEEEPVGGWRQLRPHPRPQTPPFKKFCQCVFLQLCVVLKIETPEFAFIKHSW